MRIDGTNVQQGYISLLQEKWQLSIKFKNYNISGRLDIDGKLTAIDNTIKNIIDSNIHYKKYLKLQNKEITEYENN